MIAGVTAIPQLQARHGHQKDAVAAVTEQREAPEEAVAVDAIAAAAVTSS